MRRMRKFRKHLLGILIVTATAARTTDIKGAVSLSVSAKDTVQFWQSVLLLGGHLLLSAHYLHVVGQLVDSFLLLLQLLLAFSPLRSL